MIAFDADEENIDPEKAGEIRQVLKQGLGRRGDELFDDLKKDERGSLSLEEVEKFEEQLYTDIKKDYGVEKAENVVERVKRIRLSIQLNRLEKESENKIVLRRRFEVLNELGEICLNLNELEVAENYYEEMFSLSKKLGRSEPVVSSLKHLAELYLFEGDIEKVRKKANEIVKRAKEPDDEAKRAEGIRLAGIAAWRKENAQEALNYLERSLELFKKEKMSEKIATVHRDIGDIYIDEEDHCKGIEFYRKAADNFKEVDMIYERINLLQEMGMILSEINEERKAIELFEKVQKESEEHSLVNHEAWSIFNSGELYLKRDDLTESRKKLERAVKMFEEQKDLYGEAGAKLTYGKALRKSNEMKRAEKFLKRAVELFDKLELLDSKTEALYQLSVVQKNLGREENAKKNLEKALKLSDSLDIEILKEKIVEKMGALTK